MKWRRGVAGFGIAAIVLCAYAARTAAQDGKGTRPIPPTTQSSTGSNSPNITAGHDVNINSAPDKTPPTIYLGCETVGLPIHIPPASTIHVIRLWPSQLSALQRNPNIPGGGALDSVDSPGGQALDWPSDGPDGRWITMPERQKALAERKQAPTPVAAKCSITSYGTDTLEGTVISMVVMTSDDKEHPYPVRFDPLVQQQPFTFYIVDVCSAGVFPRAITWGAVATTHVLGQQETQHVPLKFLSRGFPSSLSPFLGPSSFLWDGMLEPCQGW